MLFRINTLIELAQAKYDYNWNINKYFSITLEYVDSQTSIREQSNVDESIVLPELRVTENDIRNIFEGKPVTHKIKVSVDPSSSILSSSLLLYDNRYYSIDKLTYEALKDTYSFSKKVFKSMFSWEYICAKPIPVIEYIYETTGKISSITLYLDMEDEEPTVLYHF